MVKILKINSQGACVRVPDSREKSEVGLVAREHLDSSEDSSLTLSAHIAASDHEARKSSNLFWNLKALPYTPIHTDTLKEMSKEKEQGREIRRVLIDESKRWRALLSEELVLTVDSTYRVLPATLSPRNSCQQHMD